MEKKDNFLTVYVVLQIKAKIPGVYFLFYSTVQ